MGRRDQDKRRNRPMRSLLELRDHQVRSLNMCESYRRELGIPLVRAAAGDETGLAEAITRVFQPKDSNLSPSV
jgi:hypothetical protein